MTGSVGAAHAAAKHAHAHHAHALHAQPHAHDHAHAHDGKPQERAVIIARPGDAKPGREPTPLELAVSSKYFETGLGIIIFFNVILVLMEADATADDNEPPLWIVVTNYCLLGIYLLELSLKIAAFGCEFFKQFWNVIDFLIVLVDVILLILSMIMGRLPSVSMLRMFRLARLARAFKMLKMFPELKLLMQGLVGAAKAIFWGLVMISLLLIIWGILAVQIIHPINRGLHHDDPRTARAFSTVWQSILTFWQSVVAGDSWGQVALPIIQVAPWTLIFFGAVSVTVGLAMLNLILAVIVECATEARQEDQHYRAMQEEKEMHEAKVRLLEICEEMDNDGSGTISIDEFKTGYREHVEFSDLLKIMKISPEDLNMVFNVCDPDHSGEVEYKEFVDNLHRMKCQESQLILFYVTEIRLAMGAALEALKATPPKQKNRRGSGRRSADKDTFRANPVIKSQNSQDIKIDANESYTGDHHATVSGETKLKKREFDETISEFLTGSVDKLVTISETLATKLEISSEKLERGLQALSAYGEVGGPNPVRPQSVRRIPLHVVDAQFSPASGPSADPGVAGIGGQPMRAGGGRFMCCTSPSPVGTETRDRERT